MKNWVIQIISTLNCIIICKNWYIDWLIDFAIKPQANYLNKLRSWREQVYKQ